MDLQGCLQQPPVHAYVVNLMRIYQKATVRGDHYLPNDYGVRSQQAHVPL